MKKKGFIVLSLIFGTFAILTLSLKKCSEPVFIPQPNFGHLDSPFEFTLPIEKRFEDLFSWLSLAKRVESKFASIIFFFLKYSARLAWNKN